MREAASDAAPHVGLRCRTLPVASVLHRLPFLKDLTITGMHAVKYIGNEFQGDSAISFPSLRSMDNLEKWGTINERESFSHLSRLSISYCPKLVELPIIPSLTSLYITSCPKIIELPIFPSLTRLYIEINSATLISSVMNLTSLSDLTLFSSVMIVGPFQKHKMLESLNIPLVRNFKPLANQLNNLSRLNDLKLSCCDEIENLLDTLQNMHSLRLLEIVGFKIFCHFLRMVCGAYLHYRSYGFRTVTHYALYLKDFNI